MPGERSFRKVFLVFSLAYPLASPGVYGAFSEGFPGPLAQGAIGVGSARSENGLSVFVNPATLAGFDRPIATLFYERPFSVPGVNVSNQMAGVSFPLSPAWSLGAGGRFYEAAGIYAEQEGVLGLAWQVQPRVSVGLSGSTLRNHFIGDPENPTIASARSHSAPAVNLGVLWRFSPRVSLALAGHRVNRPDVGILQTEKLPVRWVGGFDYHLAKTAFQAELVRGGLDARSDGPPTTDWALGAEWRPLSPTRLRVVATENKLSGGVAVFWKNLRLEYAAFLSDSSSTDLGAAQRVSMSWSFGALRSPSPAPATAGQGGRPTPKIEGRSSPSQTRVPAPKGLSTSPAKKPAAPPPPPPKKMAPKSRKLHL